MGSWTDRTTYHGRAVNLGLLYICTAANKMLAHPDNGGEVGDFTMLQGSWSTSASASAGTHSGPDALDTTPYNWRNRERVFRLLGVAYWHRPAIPGTWSEHCHGITDGGAAAPAGQRQVEDYHNRLNGLANHGADQGYRMLVFPKFVFPEKAEGKPGTCWVATAGKTYNQPTASATIKRTVSRGQTFEVVAVVNVSGTYWGINAAAECFPMVNLSRTPIPSSATPAGYPADLFGKGWKYTSPFDGSDAGTYADEVKQPKLATYTSPALALESSGAVVFTVHHGGKTTSGSKNPRSELREMTADGLNEIEWDGRRGRHRMKNLTLSIDHLTVVKPHVVVAQIHGADDDLTVLRGEGVKGTNRIKMWLTKGDTTHAFSLGEVRLGDRFTFGFDVSDGKVHFDFNGARQLFTVAAADGCYFKLGNYLQSNSETAPGESTSAYSQVRLYTKPEVSHV